MVECPVAEARGGLPCDGAERWAEMGMRWSEAETWDDVTCLDLKPRADVWCTALKSRRALCWDGVSRGREMSCAVLG